MLSVREMVVEDVPLVADYWFGSTDEHLIGMGVDLSKMPSRTDMTAWLLEQLNRPIEVRDSYALIWEQDQQAIGHSNVNQIVLGQQAFMHLHLWNNAQRKKGMGTELVKLGLPFFFERLKLQALFCEPYALNPAPNKTLAKIGFAFIKKHITTPGSLNFEQPVNQWRLTRSQFEKISL